MEAKYIAIMVCVGLISIPIFFMVEKAQDNAMAKEAMKNGYEQVMEGSYKLWKKTTK